METICRYLPFVERREDRSDTLLPKEARGTQNAPEGWSLRHYPDPASPRMTIEYRIAAESNLRLSVLDALGREVALLRDGILSAGSYRAEFDGGRLPSGVYLCRMTAEKLVLVNKFALVR